MFFPFKYVTSSAVFLPPTHKRRPIIATVPVEAAVAWQSYIRLLVPEVRRDTVSKFGHDLVVRHLKGVFHRLVSKISMFVMHTHTKQCK